MDVMRSPGHKAERRDWWGWRLGKVSVELGDDM